MIAANATLPPCGRVRIPRLPNPVRHGMPLSQQERAVMLLICEDHSTKQVATALGISPKTVEKHRQNIYVKWGVHSYVGVLRHAVLNGYYEIRRWEGNPS